MMLELSKPGTSPDDMVAFFEGEGFQASIVDNNLIKISRTHQIGASSLESQHLFDISTKKFIQTLMLRDGEEVFTNAPGSSATMRVKRASGTINLTLSNSD